MIKRLRQEISNQIETVEGLIIMAGDNESIVSELLQTIEHLENCLEHIEELIRQKIE